VNHVKAIGNRLSDYAVPLGLLLVTWLVMSIWVPEFRGEPAMFATLESFDLIGLVAVGIAVTMIAGELDLSVGSVAAFSAIIAVQVSSAGTLAAIGAALAVGLVIGVAQGLVIARTGVNSLMFTVGMLIMWRGLTYVISSNKTLIIKDYLMTDPFIARYGVFSLSSIIALSVFVLLGFFLTYAATGRRLYAFGGGRSEALAAGVSPYKTLAVAFGTSGACAGLAGALAAFRGGSAVPANFADLLLPAVAAALVGGVALAGGRGTVVNVFLGTAILGVIAAALAAKGADSAINLLVQGTLLIAVLATEFGVGRLVMTHRISERPVALST
jgi:ribose transport system permease protein